jgi:uncharacterized protein (DUF924 family)
MAGQHQITPANVIVFWRAAGPDKWFTKDESFDAECRRLFLPSYRAAAAGELGQCGVAPVRPDTWL